MSPSLDEDLEVDDFGVRTESHHAVIVDGDLQACSVVLRRSETAAVFTKWRQIPSQPIDDTAALHERFWAHACRPRDQWPGDSAEWDLDPGITAADDFIYNRFVLDAIRFLAVAPIDEHRSVDTPVVVDARH